MTMRSLFIAYDLLRLVAAKTAIGYLFPCRLSLRYRELGAESRPPRRFRLLFPQLPTWIGKGREGGR
jgi:hypothetical protein